MKLLVLAPKTSTSPTCLAKIFPSGVMIIQLNRELFFSPNVIIIQHGIFEYRHRDILRALQANQDVKPFLFEQPIFAVQKTFLTERLLKGLLDKARKEAPHYRGISMNDRVRHIRRARRRCHCHRLKFVLCAD